jgi:hypothetical protein
LSRVADLAASLRAYEARREAAIRNGTTLPSDELPKPVTVQLSEDELNAVFHTFARSRGWDADLKQYMSDPTIVLEKDRLVLGGKLNELNIVASAYFATSITDDGQFRFDLVRVLGGKLPLPDMLFDSYRQKLENGLKRRLPPLQADARINSHGVPNDSTVQASLMELLMHSMRHEPSQPVFFLPLLSGKGTVPVKLTDVQVKDKQIQLTIAPMSESERAEMMQRLRAPYELQTARVQ